MVKTLDPIGRWHRLVALLLPLSVVASLIFDASGIAAGPKKTAVEAKASAIPADAKDTRARIVRIRERLGIKRASAAEPGSGCGGNRQRERRRSSSHVNWSLPPALGYVLLGLVLLAMLIPVVMAIRSGYRDTGGEKKPGGGDDDGEEEEALGEAAERGSWRVDLSDCRRLIDAGKIPEAFAALHRLTLLGLERTGTLVLDATTTNWEYVRRLVSRPEAKRMLAAVTEAAERSVLGHRPPGVTQYYELEKLVLDGVPR